MSLEEFGNKKMETKTDYYEDFYELPENKTMIPNQWTIIEGDKFVSVGHTIKSLPAGAYFIREDDANNIPFFQLIHLKNDKLIEPPEGTIQEVLKEIGFFWSKGKLFEKYGFLHYRGYLFYGTHGSGKSSIVQLISAGVVKMGGLIIYCEAPEVLIKGLALLRKIEPNRQVVVIFEDIDAIIKRYGEEKVLSYLDGESKIAGVLNIATTNYPELLDKRIVNRPRRFDRVIKINFPQAKARELYLSNKLDKGEMKEWLSKTDGLSFASLAELVIRVKLLNKPFLESISSLKESQEKQHSSEGDNRVGFQEDEEE